MVPRPPRLNSEVVMRIDIVYDSKFSFSSTRNDESYLTSMGVLKDGEDRSKKGFLKDSNTFLQNVSALKNRFPNYDYQGIQHDTVVGLMCRLVGDVRRLSDIPSSQHPILSIKDKITFVDDPQHKKFQSETMLLHTIEKDVQGTGAGVATKSHCFSSNNALSEALFSVFNSTDINDIQNLYSLLLKKDPSILNDVYKKKIYPRRLLIEMDAFKNLTNEHKSVLQALTNKPKLANIGGILLTEKIAYLKHFNLFEKELASDTNSVGCIKGITFESGGLTPKDYFVNFVKSKKQSWKMPYRIQTYRDFYDPNDMKEFNTGCSLGVIKECGMLSIFIECLPEQSQVLHDLIDNAAVQTFQLGKKGLAYIHQITL